MSVSDLGAVKLLFAIPVKQDLDMSSNVYQEKNISAIIDARRLKDFKLMLAEIVPGCNVHFYSGGNWSLHELVAYLLTITGCADLYFSTWAIREEPIRAMINWKQSGFVRSIHALLDKRSEHRDAAAIELCRSNFDSVLFDPCHAKVTVIKNDKWAITINGSQNYTKNPRKESGVISCDKTVADFHIKWMQNVGKN